MSDWSVGDWAFVYYSDDGYWYPAEITAIAGTDYTVVYDDETEETVDEDSLADYSTEVGETGAECWSDENEEWYAVNILEVTGEEVLVEFEDESTERVDLSYLRFASEE